MSPTYLHEFKSADRIASQQPVMSLYLPEQKLGSHSEGGSSSHKFMLKGRQSGSMHRGHTWIFRAETNDTMMAWYSDIKELTEKTGEARNEFVRRTHARSVSGNRPPSVSSGASQMEEDEADRVAFSGEQSVRGVPLDSHDNDGLYATAGTGAVVGTAAVLADDARSESGWRPPQKRPQPGGRFPSDVNVSRGLQAPLSPSSGDSGDDQDRDALAQAGALPGSGVPFSGNDISSQQPYPNYQTAVVPPTTTYTAGQHANVVPQSTGAEASFDTQSMKRDWVDTIAAGTGGAVLGAGATSAYNNHKEHQVERSEDQMESNHAAIPSEGYSSVPIVAASAAPADAPTEPKAMRSNEAWDLSQTYGSSVYNDAIAASAVRPSTNTQEIGSSYEPTPVVVAAVPTASRDISTSIYSAATLPHPTDSQTTNGTFIAGTDIRAPGPIVETSRSTSDYTPEPTISASNNNSDSVRPAPISTKSVQTISDLHIPGEFPRTDSKGVVRDSSMY